MRFVFAWLPCWSKKHHYSGVYKGSKFMHFDKSCVEMSQNHTSNSDQVILKLSPSSNFGFEARILQIVWFSRPKWKKSKNRTFNLDKVFLKVPPSSDFGLEARTLQISWFYRPKWKKVEESASKNKHPIKLRFLIWRLQSANPEKKVIPENQGFGSCPLSDN